MTREEYKDHILELRAELQATGRDYINQFMDHWFWKVDGKQRQLYRRDLQTFLRGDGYIHGIAEPYAFFKKIDKYLKYHEQKQRHNQKRSFTQSGD